MHGSSSPIFVVGANRSGTTLLRLMLNAHPNIGIPEEVVYFGSFMAGIPIEQWASPGLPAPAYRSFVEHFVHHQCASLNLEDPAGVIEAIIEQGNSDFRFPYQYVLEVWATAHNKARWGEKTPGNLFYADVLHAMFPTAKFIHMVRDPRAGVSSMLGTNFFPDDVVFNALSRRKFMTKGRAILHRHVPEQQRIEIRYEDLVTNPEDMARRLCAFLEEPFDAGMLAFHEQASKFMKQEASATFNQAATKPITPAMLDKWRTKLNPAQVALVESICRRQMEEWGYVRDKPSLSLKGLGELFIKKGYWHLQGLRNRRIRHYTVKSPLFARFRGKVSEALMGA